MYIHCHKTPTEASNSPTDRPDSKVNNHVDHFTNCNAAVHLPIDSSITLSRGQVQPRALKWSRTLTAKISGQYWALFTVRKFNISKNHSSFRSPRPVKQVCLRISPSFYFKTIETMAGISRNALLYGSLCSKASVSKEWNFEEGGKSHLKYNFAS